MRWWTRASSLFLSLLFLGSALDKVFHYGGFVKALGSYVLLPRALAGVVGPVVIVTEVWVGLGLLWPRWRHQAAAVSVGLLALLTVALVGNTVYAPGSICGCWFTLTVGRASGGHVLLNLLFLAVAATLWWDTRSSPTPSPSSVSRLSKSAPGSGRSLS